MRTIAIILVLFVSACGSGSLDSSMNNSNNANNENNANNDNNANNQNNQNNLNNVNNVGQDMGTADSSTNEDTGADVTNTPDMNIDLGPQYHPMFIAAADFFLEKCVACHAVGQNGLFAMPQNPDATYEDVMIAIDGVTASTGRLIIEPNDPAESQAFIMMTNAAGEQFDAATIAIVEDWINAGAPYFE